VVAVADLVLLREARGLGYNFRGLSIKWRHMSQMWLFRVMSCFLN
jgi:DUF1365 family protein